MSGVTMKTVGDGEAGMRLDRWFKAHFPNVRHGQLEKFLRKGQVRVDGGRVKSNRRLEPGETVRIPPIEVSKEPDKKVPHYPAKQRKIDQDYLRELTVYEDDQLLALNKPFGLAVQGGTKTVRHIDGLLAALEKDGDRPRLVHRLDRDTSGLLLLAKTRMAAAKLGGAFQRHEVEKTYWALAAGNPRPREGTIDLKIAQRMIRIGREDQERVVPVEGDLAKKALTDFQIIEEAGQNVSFLALRPITGRKHQIRVHCAAIGAPIVGDRKYGGEAAMIPGVEEKLHLFCRSMSYPDPKTGQRKTINAPLNGHMRKTWEFFSFDSQAEAIWPDHDDD